MNRTGFQNFVNQQLPPAEAGDFAGTNPRTTVAAPADGYVAPDIGTYVGRFAWGNPATGIMANYFQPASLLGFVHRENQALITDWMGIDSQLVPAGYPVVAQSRGDYWALFVAGAAIGDTVYADAVTGIATAGAASTGTESIGFTGAINATTGVLTVSVDGSPATSIAVGMLVTGAGVPAGTYISSLGTGVGGTGTYNLTFLEGAPSGNISAEAMNAYGKIATPFTVASTVKADASVTASIAATGVMTVTAVGSGVLEVGQFISGTDVLSYARITALISGTGGTGTYQTTSHAVASSTTITATQGQVGKITTW